jgi:hypothetical protein
VRLSEPYLAIKPETEVQMPDATLPQSKQQLVADAHRLAGAVGLAMLEADESAKNITEWHRALFMLLQLFCPDGFAHELRK